MTISTTTARVAYTGDGSTTAFAVPFYFLANADLDVYQDGTLKTITTHYTVTGAGVEAGGTVTFGTAPALDESVVIVRDTALTQATDYPPNDPFPAASHERALDRLTMIAQRNRDLIDRSFRLSDDDVSGASTELPTPEALGVIGWNAAGTALVNYDAESLAGAVAAVDWIVDTFSGTGAQTAFTLTRDPGVAANCDVSISGVTQTPGVDFTVSSTTLTFTAAPASGTGNVCVRYGSSLPAAASVPVDGVATASIQAGAVTTPKIADVAVTTAKIADEAVTQAKVDPTYEAKLIKSDTDTTLTAGYAATPYNAGTKSSGTLTPDEANGNFQYYTNGGAHTLDPPTNNCTLIIQITNNGSAGAITTSGFTKVTGTAPGTTNGDDFLAYITKINGFSHLAWQALQ